MQVEKISYLGGWFLKFDRQERETLTYLLELMKVAITADEIEWTVARAQGEVFESYLQPLWLLSSRKPLMRDLAS